MSYRDAIAIANHPRVRAMSPVVRSAYFIMWDRVADPCGMPERELCALLGWACQGQMGGKDILDALDSAGVVCCIGGSWFPISPTLFDDRDAFVIDGATSQQIADADTRAAIELAREAGMLGELSAEQWGELMDFVGKRRMESVR